MTGRGMTGGGMTVGGVTDPGAAGALILVGTPIGNLGDLAPRVIETLRDADLIACEDTRRTHALMSHAGVAGGGRLRSIAAHDETARAAWVVQQVEAGLRVAYVTDAGMPGISDPGSKLVRACLDAGLGVEVVPGPTALTAALVLSGLPTDRFVFEGFLPRKGNGRTERLAEIAAETRTVVVYESPRRVVATLEELVTHCGPDRAVSLARELTKLHEEVRRGSLAGVIEQLNGEDPRGECVIVLGGADRERPSATTEEIDAALRLEIEAGTSKKDAAAIVSARLGISRREVYERAVRLSSR